MGQVASKLTWRVCANWGVFLAFGAVLWYFLAPRTAQPKSGRIAQGATANVQAAEKPGRKERANKKSTQQGSAKPSTFNIPQVTGSVNDDDDMNNKAWAEQLANLKKGTKLTPASRSDSRPKTVKQSSARQQASDANAGFEWDDNVTPSGNDVSDMLEPAGPSPSVLRVTEPTQPVQQKKTHTPKATLQEESKKQRQNRKKAEEKKALREQEEKERRELEQKQRRTAREARGEPAKNGLASATTPASNAWAQKQAPQQSNGASAPLLDTLNQEGASTTSSSQDHTDATSVSTSDTHWERGLPSEEEQMRRIIEEQNEWSTVPSKKKGKKGDGKVSPISNESNTPFNSDALPSRGPVPQSAATQQEEKASKPNGEVRKAAEHRPISAAELVDDKFGKDYKSNSKSSHPADADWGVLGFDREEPEYMISP